MKLGTRRKTETHRACSHAGTLMMMAGLRWAGGIAAVAAPGMLPAAAYARQSDGVLQPMAAEPTCEEKRALLKLKAAQAGAPARLESIPNPKWTPGSFREHQFHYREVPATPGKVGGKSADEIDKMSCDEIDQLYSSASDGPVFLNGYAMTKDGKIGWGKEEPSSAATKTDGPSLVAPGTHPDLKTGEWPKNTPGPLSKEQLFEVLDQEWFAVTSSDREKGAAAAQAALDSGATVVGALEAAMIAVYGQQKTSGKPAAGSGGVQAGGITVPIWKGVGIRAGFGKTETGEYASVVGAEASGGVKAKDSWVDFNTSDGKVGIGGIGIWWKYEPLVPGIRGSGSFSTPIGEAGVECHSANGCSVYSEGSLSNSFGGNGEIDLVGVPRFGPPTASPPRHTSPSYRGPREGLKYFYDRSLPAGTGATPTNEGEASAAGKAGTRWFSDRGRSGAAQRAQPASTPSTPATTP